MTFCGKQLKTSGRSKYDPPGLHRCYCMVEHTGRCEEFPFLEHLRTVARRVADKIARDSTKTTGASWKSEDAGPNRISRWTMLLSDAELKDLGVNMAALKPWVVAKLREKAATFEDCIGTAQYLTWCVYGMCNSPDPDGFTRQYLEGIFGLIVKGTTRCLICRAPLDFALFEAARRGRAEIETAHAEPRSHIAGNVGFAHRACNIAQGDKTLSEFYDWIQGILSRAGRAQSS
jgi:hypothetical protein